ncbi:hypothetical protein LTR10_017111 [Elasticomyces elasticus]|uniref:AB hydrolase-1 domain-containing protein n=1 Tax=Exophiala sideris TaxID=1016849 RepID=A0ABR0JFK4_9EURO|nr:hypothetical protein LTR10_017111 [Elasticomyces elasticus]KAK5032592.1 hypothetical protein LTS07_004001 [Exophiala sideris]KAK5037228.1 hypothetical protein LTR13_005034 [Exophiala sideris]KAK5062117.1 hypothetical protein LTR69_004474 [Exophiala sideris]KAK5182386.1 hypothetical protein LTR44_005398 [Eurotiomycetes sp. CCFEE 6388]
MYLENGAHLNYAFHSTQDTDCKVDPSTPQEDQPPKYGGTPKLYPGERLETIEGHPCIYKHIHPPPRDPEPTLNLGGEPQQSLPLVVLIPGGAHNGRIYYGGHEGHSACDYLAHWLSQLGFPVLAISYPLESEPELMPPVSPALRIHTWGRQAASITRSVVDATLSLRGREILLVGWSMGGRIVAPYTEAVMKYGLRVGLFVSLAATPGVAGLRPPPPGITQTRHGYATCAGLFELFVRQIRDIIPTEVFRAEYYGHTPVSLHGWRLSHHAATGRLVQDHWQSEADATPSTDDFSLLPWMAAVVGTESLDARHVLIDRTAWEYMNVQRLTSIWEKRHELLREWRLKLETEPSSYTNSAPGSSSSQLENSVCHNDSMSGKAGTLWDAYSSFVLNMPGALTCTVSGNHYFFLGAKGAQKTAYSIAELWTKRCTLEVELWNILSNGSF